MRTPEKVKKRKTKGKHFKTGEPAYQNCLKTYFPSRYFECISPTLKHTYRLRITEIISYVCGRFIFMIYKKSWNQIAPFLTSKKCQHSESSKTMSTRLKDVLDRKTHKLKRYILRDITLGGQSLPLKREKSDISVVLLPPWTHLRPTHCQVNQQPPWLKREGS